MFDEDAMFSDAAAAIADEALGNQPANNADAPPDGGIPPAEGQSDAPADGAPAPVSTDNQAPAPAPTTPAPAAAPVAATPPPVDNQINFEGISNGLIKSPADITRISQEYAAQQAELVTLRAKVAENPFANDFIKTLDQMQRDGKSPEQVKAFMELQNLGDISKLSPINAMIEARRIRDNRDPDIARRQIEKKYGITENMDEKEREVIDADMADDAKADYEYLQSQKKELATPVASAPAAAVSTLTREAIVSQVAPIKEKVKEQFNTLGEINLTGKVDDKGNAAADAILYDLPIPAEFKEMIPQMIENFFVEQGLPVTQDNMKTALGVVNYELFNQFGVKIIQTACNQTAAETEKRIRAEYTNTNGLPKPNTPAKPSINANDLSDDQMQSYARGE